MASESGAESSDLQRGLTDEEVKASRVKHGANVLTPPPKEPLWKKILEKFDDATIRILLICATLSLVVAGVKLWQTGENHFIDGVGILIAVLLATMVGFIMEQKNERAFELLKEAEDESIQVKVTRNGVRATTRVADIVVGDIVHIATGDGPPADGQLLQCSGLWIDESGLTGESRPAGKRVGASTGEGTVAANRICRGTMVVDGHGIYLVTAVGDSTEIGALTKGLTSTEGEETPLKQKLAVLADQISAVGSIAAVLIFSVMALKALSEAALFDAMKSSPAVLASVAVGSAGGALALLLLWLKYPLKSLKALVVFPMALGLFLLFTAGWGFLSDAKLAVELINGLLLAFTVAVTIVVVAVPEGLPMMVAVSLALNSRRMLAENCLIRKQVASETIGSAGVICSDKTGTLTQNRMQPVWFLVGGQEYAATDFEAIRKTPEWDSLVRNIILDSQATLELKDGKLRGVGNPTEACLLRFVNDHGWKIEEERSRAKTLFDIPHDSNRKRSLALIDRGETHQCLMKGAPEMIMAGCAFVSINGKLEPMDAWRDRLVAAIRVATEKRALRVLGFSEKIVTDRSCGHTDVDACMSCTGRVLTGLVGIEDSIRPEVPPAIAMCRAAGIQVKMLTGDDPHVARAIAEQCGMLDSDGLVMTGAEFRQIPDDELPELAERISVLARSYPQDKLRLVRALHKRNHVVAVTGDGVNDAGALKVADVGLSMGSGTEVAKEASDIILVDDNFQSVVSGVRWGRALYENIQRFIQFQLSVNVVALLAALLGPLIGYPLPLTVPQLLWINIIMDTFAALALSMEPPRPSAMKRPPIPRDAHILTREMMVGILINGLFQVAVLLFVLIANPFGGQSQLEQQTIFFTVFVMFQFWHKFNCRSLHPEESPFQRLIENKTFIFIVVAITIVQFVMVQVGGPIGQLFRTMPLSLKTWGLILLLTASILPVAWLARIAAASVARSSHT